LNSGWRKRSAGSPALTLLTQRRSANLAELGSDFMPRDVLTTDIRGQFILLGTGTSVGVPSLGCPCEVCASSDPRDKRTRCAALVGLPQGNLLIDTPPDLRQQLLRERVGIVHAVLYTHEHADHLFGLDDLRLFPFYTGAPVPLYCTAKVEERIRRSFDYAFTGDEPTHQGAVPQLVFRTIGSEPFEVLGTSVTPVRLLHGPKCEVLGFRLGNIAYCTDVNAIPPESMAQLRGLDVLVLDALRYRPHVTHYSLGEAIDVARELAPRRTIFTHICHDLGHEATNRRLPAGMELGYDGMRFPLT
jgi:phosphoribosyl 1,2-cyclic phosphate phosphodiesterase